MTSPDPDAIQTLALATMLEMGWVKRPGFCHVFYHPSFLYHVELILGEEGNRAEWEMLYLSEQNQYQSVDNSYATPVICQVHLAQDIKDWLRKQEFPVDQILRTKRLRALLDV